LLLFLGIPTSHSYRVTVVAFPGGIIMATQRVKNQLLTILSSMHANDEADYSIEAAILTLLDNIASLACDLNCPELAEYIQQTIDRAMM